MRNKTFSLSAEDMMVLDHFEKMFYNEEDSEYGSSYQDEDFCIPQLDGQDESLPEEEVPKCLFAVHCDVRNIVN